MKTSIIIILATLALPATILLAQKQAPPAGGVPKEFSVPKQTRFELPNGLHVTLVPYGTVPKVSARLVMRTGNVDEQPDQVWLMDLVADYMKEGTTTRTAKQLAESVADMGGTFSVSASMDRTTLSGDALAEFAPRLIELLGDVVRHPCFPESELDRLKNNLLRQRSVQMAEPGSQALQKFRSVLYGDHPYGRVFPEEERLKRFSVKMVRQLYENNFSACRAHLYIAGVFDEKAVRQSIQAKFADWASGSGPTENIPHPQSQKAVYLIDRKDAPQSTLMIGLPVIDPSHPDYIGLQVTDAMLGGAFSSRITSNIREDKGYTYSPYSTVSERFRDAYWVENADVSTAVTGASLKEIFYEIKRLREQAPSSEELKGIQNYLTGVFVMQNASREGLIGQLSWLDLHGMTDSYLATYVSRIHSLTPAEIQRIMQTYLVPEKMTIVVVGDVKKIQEQVKPFGAIHI
jgi:zinc protease